jgi:MoxR-like ATPase
VSLVETSTAVEPRWLIEVRLRAQLRAHWCRELWARPRYTGEESLAISHSDVDAVLLAGLDGAAAESRLSDAQTTGLHAQLSDLLDAPPDPRWAELADELGLEPAEQELLALALAVELMPSLRHVFGYLQDETTPLDATPSLAAELWERPVPLRPGHDSALLLWALAQPVDLAADPSSSSTGWVADPTLLDHLLDGVPRYGPFGRIVPAPAKPELYTRELADVTRFVKAVFAAERGVRVEIELVAPRGSGRTTLAARVACGLGAPLVVVDCGVLAETLDSLGAAIRQARIARLSGALVAWHGAEKLTAGTLRALRRLQPLMFLLTEQQLPVGPDRASVRRTYLLAPIDRADRSRLWASMHDGPAPEPVAEWVLRPGEIESVAAVAAAGDDAMRAVCRSLLVDAPPDLLSALPQPYTWDDLVVPQQLEAHLHELEAQARGRGEVLDDWALGRLTPLGRGVTALFAGPSGTGKTMAAQVLARSLGVELYRVDLAGVVNKYIGETEKHLRTVFAACERAPALLFFDEADALFGKRMLVNDAHDRFANIEIDYLLQRIEQFDGLAVLATNRKGDLDPAFMRRLRFVIDFAPPSVDERERLWRLALEDAADTSGQRLVGEVDWHALARDLDLTGSAIKSAALSAAFLARSERSTIETRHLLASARRELEKQGVVVRSRPEAAS